MRQKRQHRIVRGERGQALVEFAVASVVFLMTVFGTLQFGLMIWNYNMISNLAQEGARWASVRGSSSTITNASSSDVQAFIDTRSTGITVTSTTTPDPVGAQGTIVTVQVQTTFAPLTGIVPMSTLTLSSTAQMVVSR
jgi:Flp pilus assembly protein TadG